MQITQAFGKEASKAVGTYAIEKIREASTLRRQANDATDEATKTELNARAKALEDAWGLDGTSRLALHVVIGGLGGGVSGAAGAAAATYTTSQLAEKIFSSDLPPALKETLIVTLGGLAGAVVGGSSGAGAGLNEAGNNAVQIIPVAVAEGALLACVRIPACVQAVARALVAGGAYVSSAAAAAAIAAHSDAVTQFVADQWNDIKGIMTGSNSNLLSPPAPITTPITTDNGPNHTGNTDGLPGVSNNTGGSQINNPNAGGNTTTTPIAGPLVPGIVMSNGYQVKPTDSYAPDWRTAVDRAFDSIGLPKEEFSPSKWAQDANGKSFPVEWTHPSGAEVNIDIGHSNPDAPSTPHIGWQTGGKRNSGGHIVGHVFVPDVPVNRSPKK
ncbi:MAG: hypothetical protein JF626_07630 [Polaromonas sp.]|nr:hypothetical protein [Polaromonas sp.]